MLALNTTRSNFSGPMISMATIMPIIEHPVHIGINGVRDQHDNKRMSAKHIPAGCVAASIL
jgi:hypothetical protein